MAAFTSSLTMLLSNHSTPKSMVTFATGTSLELMRAMTLKFLYFTMMFEGSNLPSSMSFFFILLVALQRILSFWLKAQVYELKPASFEPCRPLMERAVLDWQDLSIAGFTDGTHVQLTVADWLRLGGGVERQLDPPAPDSGDLREKYSDYSYSYSASEEEVEVEEGPAPPPPVVARASPEPNTAIPSKRNPRFSTQSVEEPLPLAPPEARSGHTTPDFPNTPPETPAWGSPSGTQGARTPGQSPGPRQRPRPHHRAGGSPPRSEEHSPGCTTQRTRESPSWRKRQRKRLKPSCECQPTSPGDHQPFRHNRGPGPVCLPLHHRPAVYSLPFHKCHADYHEGTSHPTGSCSQLPPAYLGLDQETVTNQPLPRISGISPGGAEELVLRDPTRLAA